MNHTTAIMQSATSGNKKDYILLIFLIEFREKAMKLSFHRISFVISIFIFFLLVPASSKVFVPQSYLDPDMIGPSCNISFTPCDIQARCRNLGICNNTKIIPRGYICECQLGFNGTDCEFDVRPCKDTTCLNNGINYLYKPFILRNIGSVCPFRYLF